MKLYTHLLACVVAMASAVPAQAAIITSIQFKNALPTWLQVAEVSLYQAGTGINVARASNGGVATASSVYGPAALGQVGNYAVASFANDGSTNGDYGLAGNGIYHSGSDDGSDWLRITLAAPTDISRLSINGRTDCCSNRDVYSYSAFNGSALVASGFLDADNGDNFATVSFASAAVPEPASWMMLLAGFGAVGFAMRTRKRRTTALI
jgi:PEP-CTERM motif